MNDLGRATEVQCSQPTLRKPQSPPSIRESAGHWSREPQGHVPRVCRSSQLTPSRHGGTFPHETVAHIQCIAQMTVFQVACHLPSCAIVYSCESSREEPRSIEEEVPRMTRRALEYVTQDDALINESMPPLGAAGHTISNWALWRCDPFAAGASLFPGAPSEHPVDSAPSSGYRRLRRAPRRNSARSARIAIMLLLEICAIGAVIVAILARAQRDAPAGMLALATVVTINILIFVWALIGARHAPGTPESPRPLRLRPTARHHSSER